MHLQYTIVDSTKEKILTPLTFLTPLPLMSHRPQQVAKEIHKAISPLIQEVLPLERYSLVTITDVEVTGGLESAKIFVSSLRNDHTVIDVLNQRAGFFKNELKKKMKLRMIPQLFFKYDIAGEQHDRLHKLLNEQ